MLFPQVCKFLVQCLFFHAVLFCPKKASASAYARRGLDVILLLLFDEITCWRFLLVKHQPL